MNKKDYGKRSFRIKSPRNFISYSRKVPVAKDYDVIVAGGGPAGMGAALSAAWNGARTLIIDTTGCFGGMGTSGLLPCFCPYSYNKNEPVIKGIGWEILEKLRAKNGIGGRNDLKGFVPIDNEKLKVVYDELITENDVDYLFFTMLCDVIVENKRIETVIAGNKHGLQAFSAEIFIDCTGDADLAFMAGAPCVKGNEAGKMQATTLCFNIGGTDTAKYLDFWGETGDQKGLRTLLAEALKNGKLDDSVDRDFTVLANIFDQRTGTLKLNLGHLYGVDGTDPVQLSRAMVAGRKLAHTFLDFARKEIKGMENAEISSTGSLLGVRETRRIRGKFRLEQDAFYEARHFDDDIAVYDYPVDVHESEKRDSGANAQDYRDSGKIAARITYGIPFRTMLPENIDNLLVAGRSISADRVMQGTTRVMPACFAMGEAAGIASVMAVEKNIAVRQIPIKELQDKLIQQGANLNG
jgi:hypothetical protein